MWAKFGENSPQKQLAYYHALVDAYRGKVIASWSPNLTA